MNLPIFSDEKELAWLIHIGASKIQEFSRFPHRYYLKYTIPKSGGGVREIRQPSKELKGVQAWILRNILDKLTPSPYATAYNKGTSITINVFPHSGNRFFICIDLEDFFPSISIRRVIKIFSLIGYSDKASAILAALCTCEWNLPQGAITSPSLSNLVATKLDRRIAGYTSIRNIVYTRYADDITLSSNNPAILCKALPRIIKIIKSEHFKLNMDKLRVLGPRMRCSITGLVKNSSESKFGIGRNKKREIRAIMHNLLFTSKKDKKYASRESIEGWLSYLKSVDKESFKKMDQYWNKLIQKSTPRK